MRLGGSGVRVPTCSLQLMLILFLLELQAALTDLCLVGLALLPQALTLSQKSLPAYAGQTLSNLVFSSPVQLTHVLTVLDSTSAQSTAALHTGLLSKRRWWRCAPEQPGTMML